MVLGSSASQSFMRLCAGFCSAKFACNEAILHLEPGVVLVNRRVTPLQASQMHLTGLRIRLEQLSHSLDDKEKDAELLPSFLRVSLPPLSYVEDDSERFSLRQPGSCGWSDGRNIRMAKLSSGMKKPCCPDAEKDLGQSKGSLWH